MTTSRKPSGALTAVILAAGLLLTGALPGQARADEFAAGAQKFIETLANDAITQLTTKDITRNERASRFRQLMHDGFAIKGIAKFVLGRHWRKASEAERTEYLTLFEDLLVATYADRFAKYAGEKLVVQKAEVRGKNDALVHSTLKKIDGTKPFKVAWRVRAKGDTYKVVDIMVEGVSMVQTQKSEFASFIRQNNGDLGALLVEIRKRIGATET